MEPDLSARRRLGVLVRQARRDAGFISTREWAEKVGRSDRQLLGLERGEKVGIDTYAAVAKALGWPLDRVDEILSGKSESSGSTALADVSDEALVEEIRRRLNQRAGDGDEAAPTNVRDLRGKDMRTVQKKAAKSKPRTDT